MNILNNIRQSFIDIFKVWRQEFRNVFHDAGVMIFFLLLPTAYPIVYSLIYNPELVREVPVVVVDNSRTALSRQFIRSANATQNIDVVGYAADIHEAQRAMHEKACYGIIMLPSDFSTKIGRGEQTNVVVYCDMSLLLRYKAILSAISEVGFIEDAKVQMDVVDQMGASYITSSNMNPVQSYSFAMGDTEMGFASFILPGILILILQQSMVLGIGMLGAGENERRLKHNGVDPQSVNTGVLNTMIGRALCYFMIYLPSTIYILYFVPRFFLFPQAGDYVQIFLFVLPYLLTCVFFGMTLQVFIREREDAFPVVVFTSVIFLFLSGLTWPRYAMSPIWKMLSDIIPATWGVEGFIKMNGNSSTLAQVSPDYQTLWIMCIVYFILAYFVYRFVDYRKTARPLRDSRLKK